MKLYMLMIGCKPKGRNTEQHDVFFGIGDSLAAIVPQLHAFWPEALGIMHIDAWREVTVVDQYIISIVPKRKPATRSNQLFFFNLGGYKENEFEEYHYKMLTVAEHLADGTKLAKATSFYKHVGFSGAVSHIDDKYGIDVDDVYKVIDMLHPGLKSEYQLQITRSATVLAQDELHIGYLKLDKLLKS